ncbi:hypothetical protein pb186bvf_014960 [Paramecium bursaria]
MIKLIISGQIASTLPWFFLNPLDVARIKLQAQGELQTHGSYKKYGFYGMLKNLYMQEGIKGWYRGFVPIFFLCQFNGVRLGLYEHTRELPIPRIISAFCLGSIQGFVGSPFNLIKTRNMLGEKQVSITNGLKMLIQQKMVFKGAQWASARWGVNSLVQLPIFDFCVHKFRHLPEIEKVIISSLCATFTMTTIGQPLDLLITRIYNRQDQMYGSLLKSIKLIIQVEGFRGLYKGYVASVLTFGPASFTQLFIFQYLLDSL